MWVLGYQMMRLMMSQCPLLLLFEWANKGHCGYGLMEICVGIFVVLIGTSSKSRMGQIKLQADQWEKEVELLCDVPIHHIFNWKVSWWIEQQYVQALQHLEDNPVCEGLEVYVKQQALYSQICGRNTGSLSNNESSQFCSGHLVIPYLKALM